MSIEQEKVVEESNINWTKLFFISFFLGFTGLGRFLAGRRISGAIKFLTMIMASVMMSLMESKVIGPIAVIPLVGVLLWWYIDLLLLASGRFIDSYGRRVTNTKTQRYVSLSFLIIYGAGSLGGIAAENLSNPVTDKPKQQTEMERQKQEQQAQKEQELLQVYKQRYEDIQKGVYEYKSVKIGKQTWMAENLAYNVLGSRCYEDNITYCYKYGRLYDWATAMKACPKGWHLPTNVEWDNLYHFADGTSGTQSPYRSETAGIYLKATTGWNNNGHGEDKFGFAALPGGGGDIDGSFGAAGDIGQWWSAKDLDKEFLKGTAAAYVMRYDKNGATGAGILKEALFSVRCIKNDAKAKEEVSSMPSKSNFSSYNLMKDKNFAKDIDKVLKNVKPDGGKLK